jgi:hypothetical protein
MCAQYSSNAHITASLSWTGNKFTYLIEVSLTIMMIILTCILAHVLGILALPNHNELESLSPGVSG